MHNFTHAEQYRCYSMHYTKISAFYKWKLTAKDSLIKDSLIEGPWLTAYIHISHMDMRINDVVYYTYKSTKFALISTPIHPLK